MENCERKKKDRVMALHQLGRYVGETMESDSCSYDSDGNEKNTVYEEFEPA